MAIAIRASRPDDAEGLFLLFRDSIHRVAARDYSPEQLAAWAPPRIEGWAEARAALPTWVAEIDGSLAGFTDLRSDGLVDMLFVSADHQGRGVATALLATVEQAAHRLGLRRLHTEASITAKPFFERRGFRMVRQQQIHLEGQVLTNYRMEKNL